MKKLVSFMLTIVFIVSIVGTMNISVMAANTPSFLYEMTDVVYTVDGEKYF